MSTSSIQLFKSLNRLEKEDEVLYSAKISLKSFHSDDLICKDENDEIDLLDILAQNGTTVSQANNPTAI